MDDDFIEFIQYLDDVDLAYLPIPRRILRDPGNPLERYTSDELVQRYRFGRDTIENLLLPMVYPENPPATQRGLPIPPIIKLCTALRFYATGSFQRTVGDLETISQPSSCRIVAEVSERLTRRLREYVKFPQGAEAANNRNRFYNMAHFPGVTGCVDGTHIEIINPGGPTAENFRNRKGWMSLNVQVVAGSRYELLDIVIRWPGSAHDSRIFNSSAVKMRFEQRRIQGLLLGDSAYPQSSYLYTPILNPQTRAEVDYNTAQILTRGVVERMIGIWKGRFRCLMICLNCKLPKATRIIAATAVLHNIAMSRREPLPDNLGGRDVPNLPAPQANVRGNAIKAAFVQRHFAG